MVDNLVTFRSPVVALRRVHVDLHCTIMFSFIKKNTLLLDLSKCYL